MFLFLLPMPLFLHRAGLCNVHSPNNVLLWVLRYLQTGLQPFMKCHKPLSSFWTPFPSLMCPTLARQPTFSLLFPHLQPGTLFQEATVSHFPDLQITQPSSKARLKVHISKHVQDTFPSHPTIDFLASYCYCTSISSHI